MKVSAITERGDQAVLWDGIDDRPLKNSADARVVLGDAAEQVLASLTGATRHATDRTSICPDLSHPGHRYLECKALRHGGELIVFKHRLDRDRRLVRDTGGSLVYCLVVHAARFEGAGTRAVLRRRLVQTVDRVLVIPLAKLRAACRRRRSVMLQYRPNHDARECWRLPWRALLALAGHYRAEVYPRATMIHGNRLGSVPFYGPNDQAMAHLSPEQQQAAGWMLDEMEHLNLHVELVPAPRQQHHGHKVRVAVERNPEWYRELCLTSTKRRRRARRRRLHDTDCRRPQVLAALRSMARGGCPRTAYQHRLLPFVNAYLTQEHQTCP